MDWGRAKTYLIITFFVLNVLLVYQWSVVRGQPLESAIPFDQQLKDVTEVLQSRHIALDPGLNIPNTTPTLGFLQVRYADPPNDLARKALGDQSLTEAAGYPSQVRDYSNGNGEFHVIAPSIFRVMWYKSVARVDTSDPHLFRTVLRLIAPQVWNSDLFSSDYVIRQGQGDATVLYTQQYNGYPVFSSGLTVHVASGQIIGYEQSVLQVQGEDNNSRRTVLSAISALHALADTLDNVGGNGDNHHITDIRLGYYSFYSATRWYLTPMWRIVTDFGVYYVNAFTGEVQQYY